jgi:hypothetical protein
VGLTIQPNVINALEENNVDLNDENLSADLNVLNDNYNLTLVYDYFNIKEDKNNIKVNSLRTSSSTELNNDNIGLLQDDGLEHFIQSYFDSKAFNEEGYKKLQSFVIYNMSNGSKGQYFDLEKDYDSKALIKELNYRKDIFDNCPNKEGFRNKAMQGTIYKDLTKMNPNKAQYIMTDEKVVKCDELIRDSNVNLSKKLDIPTDITIFNAKKRAKEIERKMDDYNRAVVASTEDVKYLKHEKVKAMVEANKRYNEQKSITVEIPTHDYSTDTVNWKWIGTDTHDGGFYNVSNKMNLYKSKFLFKKGVFEAAKSENAESLASELDAYYKDHLNSVKQLNPCDSYLRSFAYQDYLIAKERATPYGTQYYSNAYQFGFDENDFYRFFNDKELDGFIDMGTQTLSMVGDIRDKFVNNTDYKNDIEKCETTLAALQYTTMAIGGVMGVLGIITIVVAGTPWLVPLIVVNVILSLVMIAIQVVQKIFGDNLEHFKQLEMTINSYGGKYQDVYMLAFNSLCAVVSEKVVRINNKYDDPNYLNAQTCYHWESNIFSNNVERFLDYYGFAISQPGLAPYFGTHQ